MGSKIDVRPARYADFPKTVLLTGIPGVGKRTLSREWAAGLLCRGPEDERPCGQCRSCRRLKKGIEHENLICLSLPKDRKTIGVKQVVKGVVDRVSLSSLESGNRVVLIHQADLMTAQAQNALLKTLEDPPDDHTYFIMTADRQSAILPTVISRCSVIHAPLWDASRIRETLVQKGYPKNLAERVSLMAGGSIGAAIAMCDNKQAQQADQTVSETILRVRSAADIQEALNALKAMKDMDQPVLKALQQQMELLLSLKMRNENELLKDLFEPQWVNAPIRSLERIFECVMEAARYRASNVSFLTEAENIMRVIAEECAAWPQLSV